MTLLITINILMIIIDDIIIIVIISSRRRSILIIIIVSEICCSNSSSIIIVIKITIIIIIIKIITVIRSLLLLQLIISIIAVVAFATVCCFFFHLFLSSLLIKRHKILYFFLGSFCSRCNINIFLAFFSPKPKAVRILGRPQVGGQWRLGSACLGTQFRPLFVVLRLSSFYSFFLSLVSFIFLSASYSFPGFSSGSLYSDCIYWEYFLPYVLKHICSNVCDCRVGKIKYIASLLFLNLKALHLIFPVCFFFFSFVFVCFLFCFFHFFVLFFVSFCLYF